MLIHFISSPKLLQLNNYFKQQLYQAREQYGSLQRQNLLMILLGQSYQGRLKICLRNYAWPQINIISE